MGYIFLLTDEEVTLLLAPTSVLQKNIYTSEHSINLYTEGKADLHPMISHYLIKAYPTIILVDKNGKLCEHPINPRLDDGANLVSLINKALGL